MKLEIHQEFRSHGADDVIAAYADPGLYRSMDDLPFVGKPSLLDHAVEGGVALLAVHWAVQVDLPTAARVFVDPARLSFVEHTRMTGGGMASFHVEPDHYRRLLAFAGTYRVEPGPDRGARRTVAGELRVDLGWKGRLVEREVARVIAAGLTDALHAQVAVVERYLG